MAGHFETERVLIYEGGPGIFGDDEEENFYDQWIDYDEGRHDDRLDAVEKFLEACMISGAVARPKEGRIRNALAKARFS